ncbi:unnamed protein product [Cuscuta europaea]|uniref:Uncharacterized protein n=2 Tax=Cuscuta europaea TaxID=41803 RepID=A0A9P1EF95_CUSEU|nr:unnamed protein product [Cuscuta europaea]
MQAARPHTSSNRLYLTTWSSMQVPRPYIASSSLFDNVELSYRPLGPSALRSGHLYLMNQTSYCGRSLDPSLSHLYLMTRTTDHDELPTSRDRPRPSSRRAPLQLHLQAEGSAPFVSFWGHPVYSFSLIRIFSHRVFPNEVFNEASPHRGSKGVNPRPPVEDIIRHTLLYSTSPHYTRLKEWGTGRAGDLAPPLTKEAKIQIFVHEVYSPDGDRSAHSSTLFHLEYSRLREWGTPDRVYRLGPPGLTTIGPGQRPTHILRISFVLLYCLYVICM